MPLGNEKLHNILKNKKVVFFDVGYTLDYPASGDWMFIDALQKCGCEPKEAVYIDDSVRNLEGAEKLGITPILIAANPVADVETKYCKIHSLSELLL